MRFRMILERMTLFLLVILLVVSTFLFIEFLARQTMNWSIFPQIGSDFFDMILPYSLLMIFILSMFNMALNVGIATTNLVRKSGELPTGKELRKTNLIIAGVLALFIAISLIAMYGMNQANMGNKITDLEREMETFVETNQDELETMADLTRSGDNLFELMSNLTMISSANPHFRNMNMIVPVKQEDRYIFKQVIQGWNGEAEIDEDSFELEYEKLFQPNQSQLEYFNEILSQVEEGEAVFGKAEVLTQKKPFEVFYPLVDEEDRNVVFLYSDEQLYGE